MSATLKPTDYYRLPWTLTDNVLSWLEPTKRCNLYCEGCYSHNAKGSDKTLEQIRADLDLFTSQRTVDSISVAGGDPLVHPEIVEITRMIKEDYGLKPVLNTNGLALTPELLKELKRAGVFGFTFHIDSSQGRPGWEGKDEIELNELRLQYAQMCAAAGDISVAFNSTVFPHTLDLVPGMLEWARRNIDIVHIMVFILFRTTRTNEFDYFAQGKPVDPAELVYYDEDKLPEPIMAQDIVDKIREAEPEYDPCAYLGGTKDPNTFKWLLAQRVGTSEKIHGYTGKRFMEMAQTGHHLARGRYLAYSKPSALRHGRLTTLAGSLFDKGLRSTALRWAGSVAQNPLSVTNRLHMQSVLIIQPIDMQADGQTNMCDGCPDMTVHNGELVWSCRLEERLKYGCFLTCAPRKEAQELPQAKVAKVSDPEPAKKTA
jgi:hypothetical protein